MPKIRNQSIISDDGNHRIEVPLSYDTKEKRFQITLPDDMQFYVETFDYKKQSEFSINYIRKRGQSYSEKSAVIVAENEKDCIFLTKKLYNEFVSHSRTERDVIMVKMDDNKDVWNNDFRNSRNYLDKAGLSFGIIYAKEVAMGPNINYVIDDRYNRTIDGKGYKILEDTPENREALESIYARIIQLRDRLTNITKSPEEILNFIQSGVKLLN